MLSIHQCDKMRISRHCSNKLVILTCIVMLLMVISTAIIAIFRVVVLPQGIDRIANVYNMLNCYDVAMTREIYQHDQYWVLKNSIRAEQGRANCMLVTLTLQGTYEDVYKLEYLFSHGLTRVPVSFAVYIPTEEHLDRTLRSIAYVRNCVHTENKNKETQYLIREYVTFHLYFRIGEVTRANLLKDLEQVVGQERKCIMVESSQSPESSEELEVSEDVRENAMTVGRNIAQLSANTKVVLRTDADTYPSANFFDSWAFTNLLLPRMKETSRKKLVYRLPTFLFDRLNDAMQAARVDAVHFKQLLTLPVGHNWGTYDSEEWLLKKNLRLLEIYNFGDFMLELLSKYSYFICARDGPLLDDRMGYTLIQSENLRMFQMIAQNYTFVVPHTMYMLHNITDADFQPRNQLSKMAHEMHEYADMYD